MVHANARESRLGVIPPQQCRGLIVRRRSGLAVWPAAGGIWHSMLSPDPFTTLDRSALVVRKGFDDPDEIAFWRAQPEVSRLRRDDCAIQST